MSLRRLTGPLRGRSKNNDNAPQLDQTSRDSLAGVRMLRPDLATERAHGGRCAKGLRPVKKPPKDASAAQHAAYREWVRARLKDWDPADDRGGPGVYVPRYDGIRAHEVENVRERNDVDSSD